MRNAKVFGRFWIELSITLTLIFSMLAVTAPASSALVSQTFHYTGGPQIYVVPENTTSISVTLEGASGETPNGGGQGGKGGRVKATIAVTPGEVLEIQVGGQGGISNGYNGGGGDGGGGASDIRRPTFSTTSSCAFTLSCTYNDRIIVAGGGGAGGGYLGVPPIPSFVHGGDGGYVATNGLARNDAFNSLPIGDATSGAAGTQSAGGAHGIGTKHSAGQGAGDGEFGYGGSAAWVAQAIGGGGGGGYYGGGGGGVSENTNSQANGAGGGGGGSSWAGGTGVTPDPTTPYEDGVVTGDGSITIDIPSAITDAAFGFTGAPQFYTVPETTRALSVRLYGAGTGQTGDIVYGNLPVTSGEVLQINIGGRGWGDNRYAPAGTRVGQGGWNGGGDGEPDPVWGGGGGGGGATDLRRCANASLATPCDLSTRMVVSGGGGYPACSAWGLNGGNGGSFLNGSGGLRGNPSGDPALIGGGGTLIAGGAGFGTFGANETITAGSLGQGGTAIVAAQCGGNGGGGGLYGGGGSRGDGGGGGSSCASITDTCTSTSNLLGITGAAFTHTQSVGGSIADGSAVIVAMPVATTGSVSQITSTTANISGTINPKFLASTPTLFYSTTQADVEACSAAGVVGNCPSVSSKYLVSNHGSWSSSSTLTLAGNTTQSLSGSLTGLSANNTYYYRICAQSVAGYGCGATLSFSTQLAITNQSLHSGQAGTAYIETLTASGGSGTYTQWAITASSLPAGITLDSTTGIIAGTPTSAQVDTVTFQVTDSSNGTATRILSIVISAAPPPPNPPSTPSAPAPDRNQQSSVTSISPAEATSGSPVPVVITGSFVEQIIAIQLNGVPLPSGSWIQTPTTISFTLPGSTLGSCLIQIFNGSAPLLPIQNLNVQKASSSIASTLTPTPNTQETTTSENNNTTIPQPTNMPIATKFKINVHFGMGDSVINKANGALLEKFAQKLIALSPGMRIPITITAYTQPTPLNPNPSTLSHKRAVAVEVALMKLGVSAHFTLINAGNGPVNQSHYRLAEIIATITH